MFRLSANVPEGPISHDNFTHLRHAAFSKYSRCSTDRASRPSDHQLFFVESVKESTGAVKVKP